MGKTKKEPKLDKLSNKIVDLRDELAYTVEEKHDLENEAADCQPEIEDLEKKLLRLESQVYERIPGEFIITFVKGINKALQYYQYLLYLRTCDFINLETEEEEIFEQLVKEQEEVEEPNKVSKRLIRDCLNARIKELTGAQDWKDRQFMYRRYLKEHRVKNVKSMIQATYPDLKNVKVDNRSLLTDKISTKVFKTIEKEYIMDPDPKVELLNILKSDPQFYYAHFGVGKSPIEESLVAEAVEEYACFRSKYVKTAIAAEVAVEKGEVDNNGMPDTILLDSLYDRMRTPFPVIEASHIKPERHTRKKRRSATTGKDGGQPVLLALDAALTIKCFT